MILRHRTIKERKQMGKLHKMSKILGEANYMNLSSLEVPR